DRVRVAGAVYRSAAHELPKGRCIAAIRPHRIHLTAARDPNLVSNSTNAAKGIVRTVTYIRDIVQYDVEISDGVLLKIEQHTQGSGLRHNPGDEVLCEWSPHDMLVFRQEDA